MAIDWDAELIGPLTSQFGLGDPENPKPIRYTSSRDGSVFDINGVFDEAHEQIEVDGNGTPISTVSPILGVQLSAFPPGAAPKKRDMLVIGGTTYIVGDVQSDGHGWALLILNKRETGP
jgi:hypothetical protein